MNIVRKVESVERSPAFLCFSQFFQRCVSSGASKVVTVWYGVNPLPDDKILKWSKLKQIAEDVLKVPLVPN